jgi:hypothetical protein
LRCGLAYGRRARAHRQRGAAATGPGVFLGGGGRGQRRDNTKKQFHRYDQSHDLPFFRGKPDRAGFPAWVSANGRGGLFDDFISLPKIDKLFPSCLAYGGVKTSSDNT